MNRFILTMGSIKIVEPILLASGKYAIRKQSFDNATGNLKATGRRINDNYSIYSNPTNGLFGLHNL